LKGLNEAWLDVVLISADLAGDRVFASGEYSSAIEPIEA